MFTPQELFDAVAADPRVKAYPRLVQDVNALIQTFLLPATNNLTTKQQAALDNLVGTMLDLGE